MQISKYLLSSAAALVLLPVQTSVIKAEPITCGDYYNFVDQPDGDILSAPESSGWEKTRLASEDVCRNLAISNALADAELVYGEKYSVRLNFGTAANESVGAIGLGVAAVLSDNLNGNGARLTGSGAVAFSGNQRGARIGLQISW